MNRKLLIGFGASVALVTVLGAGVAFAAMGHGGRGRMMKHMISAHIEDMEDYISATPDQRATIEASKETIFKAQELQHLGAERFDILLVDFMRPGMDGLTLSRKTRERWNTPLIMVTARGDDADKIVGLELGADDSLAKPFNPRELLARVRAVLRRAEPGDQARFQSGGLGIDFKAREGMGDGARQTLTAHAYELLVALARNAGRVLTRDQLLEQMKGDHADEAFDRSIDVHVSRLRQKIELDPRHPRYVKTVRGAGYLLSRET